MRTLVVILVFLVVGFTCKSYGQDSTRNMVLKVDLLWPATIIPQYYTWSGLYEYRFSLELESKFEKLPDWLYCSFDSEFIFSEGSPDTPDQMTYRTFEFFGSLGLRVYIGKGLVNSRGFCGFFIEPKVSFGYMRFDNATWVGWLPNVQGNLYTMRPRLKAGFSYLFNNRIALGLESEALIRRYSVSPDNKIDFFPEINFGYSF